MITGSQIRSARAAVGWSAEELGATAGIASRTVRRIEAKEAVDGSYVRTVLAIRAALEAAGIEFIVTPDGAPGIVIRSGR